MNNLSDTSAKPTNFTLRALLNSLGVAAYVTLVALVMYNAERVFGEIDSFIGPVAFLLLFTTSAAVVGSLIFGQPLLLFLGGRRTEALRLVITTIAFLMLETALALLLIFLTR